VLDAELHRTLVTRYADAVARLAKIAPTRREDLEEAPRFSAAGHEITCTCGITGSTYIEEWDGSNAAALAFADAVGEATAGLVAKTKKHHHYAWLYSSR
jgi:hypothetical protein